jgi:hypothetical protein
VKDTVLDISPRRGRPRKFESPSRAVTLTLPEHVIDALGSVDADLSRAVVRLAQPEMAKRPHPPAELATFGTRAVIVVNPTRTLEQHTGVHLIPLPDGRALISFDAPLTIADLELMIEDVIDDRRLSPSDQAVFKAIADLLRAARRSETVELRQRNIIVIESRRSSRPAPARQSRKSRGPAAKVSSSSLLPRSRRER